LATGVSTLAVNLLDPHSQLSSFGAIGIFCVLLGSRVPNVDTYLLPIIAAIVVLSLIPVALEVQRSRRSRASR